MGDVDRLSILPDELLLVIGEHARPRDLTRLTRVSRRIHEIVQDCLWIKAKRTLGWYPIFHGANKCDTRLMAEALRRGCPVDTVWSGEIHWNGSVFVGRVGIKAGYTPLCMAVKNGDPYAVNWLLAAGADMDIDRARRLSGRPEPQHPFSLLSLVADNSWAFLRFCHMMEPAHVASLALEWHVTLGPRYRVYDTLVRAGARLPAAMEMDLFRFLALSCRVVTAPMLQILLENGADINLLCLCPQHAGSWGHQPGTNPYIGHWIFRYSQDPIGCRHNVHFRPFSKATRERIWAGMCPTLRAADDAGRRLFRP